MHKLLQYARKSIKLQKGWSQNIPGFYQIAVAQVCLHVDDDNFACESNRQLGNRINARKGINI